MKILIIGGGAVAEMFHIPASIELFGINNVFIAEPNDIQKQKVSEKFNLVNTFKDFHEAIEKVDFVIISTPPQIHKEISIECINANLPILCEKPLANTLKECESIIKSIKINNRVFAVCHTFRFFPNRIHIRKMINAEYFGNKIYIDIQQGDPSGWQTVSGYTFRKEFVPGGVLLNEGIHSLDFLLWCFGKPTLVEYLDDSIGGIESNASMILNFNNNVKANFRISRTCTLTNKIMIKGSSKCAELDIYDMEKITLFQNGEKEIKDMSTEQPFNWNTIAIYQLQDFLDSIRNNKKPSCDAIQAAEVIDLIECCYNIKKSLPLPEKAPIQGLRWGGKK